MQKKIVMLTAYSTPSAFIADNAGVDIILVGDSVANVVHGFKSTKEIGMEEMLLHVKACARAKPKALLVADMPYKSYSNSMLALENAKKFLDAGAKAIKIEGFDPKVMKTLTENKIKVMGHIGYLPQTDKKPIIKKDEKKLLEEALNLEATGCEWIVLELVPEKIAKLITEKISIPTIGIGSGRYCSGQVLVFHDLLGLNPVEFKPKYLKQYANLKKEAIKAVKQYAKEVRTGKFPQKKNCY